MVITAATAVASMLDPGSSALVCAGDGVVDALEGRGVTQVRRGPADAVVVEFHRDFNYERLATAHRAVCDGARLVATNDDPTYPTPDGPIPGAGAILAAVTTATGVKASVAGKPFPPMVSLVRSVVGDEPCTVVGDRDSTDGRFARALGARFAPVLSGATLKTDLPSDPPADVVAPNLASLVAGEC